MRFQSKLFSESWNVAWRIKKEGIFKDKDSEFHVIDNAYRYWAADPFVIEYDNDVYVFAELYDYTLHRGVIGYCTLRNKKWVPVIKEEYHLSYPFLFKRNNNIYMLPETSEDGSLCIYSAVEFPDKWEKKTILKKDVKYVDTTPFTYNDEVFALTYDIKMSNKPLLILLGFTEGCKDQIVHINNTDIVRPAGGFFYYNTELYRPAQNCVGGYGKGLLFYKCSFDGNDYREESVAEIFASDLALSKKMYLDGMHTYNMSEHYEVIDIKTKRFNLLNLIFRLLGKLKR